MREEPAPADPSNAVNADRWSWTLEEQIPNEADAGKRILDEVIKRLEAAEWVQHDIFGVHLALEEALVNAMKHGNGFDPNKSVEVVCKIDKDRLRLEVADDGPGFDPQDVPDPTEDDNLEIPSGRGIMLMRSFMSNVTYNDRGNRVIMEKDRTSS